MNHRRQSFYGISFFVRFLIAPAMFIFMVFIPLTAKADFGISSIDCIQQAFDSGSVADSASGIVGFTVNPFYFELDSFDIALNNVITPINGISFFSETVEATITKPSNQKTANKPPELARDALQDEYDEFYGPALMVLLHF